VNQAARQCDCDAEQPRILITRLSAIGDCVQTLPVATALRERFPRAFIAWAVEAGAAPLVAANRAVDRMVVVPKRMLASPAAAWRVRRELAPLRIEITIDPQGLSKSSAIAWLSGARRRIGFARPQGREISPWLNNEPVQPRTTHMVERYLELLEPLGIEQAAARFAIEIDPVAERTIASWVARAELADGFAVINPGAGWDSKRWPVARFAAVAHQLGARHGLPSVVAWGGPREQAVASELVDQAAGHALLAPATTLLELAALLKRARLLVAADTGPLHLAAAVGTPCVGIFGSTRREACGPYGAGNVALQAAFDGSSGRKLPGADNWAIRRVSVEMVAEACQGILRRTDAQMPALAAR
jgi:lipopolysaccharide heptosyltransferase I